jgi:microcompartment protein CcmL/EutN
VELFSTASTVLAADVALKAAEADVIEIRLAVGIGGKGFFILTGKLEEVEAAVEAAKNITKSGLLVSTEIIPAPHLEVHNFLS